MFSRTVLFIGLHLLCFTDVANPMVLLTANVDDIKKIARKFLSDSVAETIAEFLLRATGSLQYHNRKGQISEENDRNEKDIDNVSAEDKVGRVQKKRTTTTKDYVDYEMTTKRHYSQGRMVYNTPAFEQDADLMGLDVTWEDDLNKKATLSDNAIKKQERELYRQQNADYNYVNDFTTRSAYDQYDLETVRPRQKSQNSRGEEDEYDSNNPSWKPNKIGKQRLLATSGSIILPRVPDDMSI